MARVRIVASVVVAAMAVVTLAHPTRLLLPLHHLDYDDPVWSLETYERLEPGDDTRYDAPEGPRYGHECYEGRGEDMTLQQPRPHDTGDLLGLLPSLQKNKRYLGIDLPDYIASKKELGKLKQKMMNSGK